MRYLYLSVCILSLACASVLNAQNPLLVEGFEALAGWEIGGQREISFSLSDGHVRQGRHALRIHVEIDHRHEGQARRPKYPMGWPSVRKIYRPAVDLSAHDFLELDVYFDSRRSRDPDFALHVTFKDSKGHDIYRTTCIDLRHGKWAHEKLCIRDISNAKDLGQISFWLSESAYDHGDVIDFYVDNLRATRSDNYQPPEAKPVRRPLVKSQAATLWFEGPARKIMRTEKVHLAGAADPAVKMSAARNETEAVQLVLWPHEEKQLGEVSVDIGELVGAAGAKIAAENVFWSPVYYVPAQEGPPEGLPDGLPGPRPFVANKQWHWPIWLEVYVPPGTNAGDYVAPITVHTGRGDLNAKLQLHVWDFDIPVKQHLRTSTTIYGPYGWREDIKKWYGDMSYNQFINNWRPKIVALLSRHRLCPSHLCHLPLTWDRKKKEVVLEDARQFERHVESYLSMGHHLNGMPVPYFFDRSSFLGAPKGTDEYLRRIAQAYRVAATYLEEKDWLKGSYVYCVDEVVVHKHTTPRDFNLLNRVFDAIHTAHPRIRIFGAETPSPLLRGMNVWCININCFDTDVLAQQHALGNEVWWYNGYGSPRPGTRIAARGVDHRALFWLTYKYGIDGYLIWTVNRWTNDPWKEPNRSERTAAGNHYLLYPNPDGTVSPSIRLCMMRDGLEDYEYHWLLGKAAKKLRAQGQDRLAEDCERTIRQADAFILAYDNCSHIKPNFLYDSRRLLAKQIEKALTALPHNK